MVLGSTCRGCPSQEGVQLRFLAEQTLTIGDWLLQNDGLGFFSTNAVRTTVQYYNMEVPPDHWAYGSFTGGHLPPDLARLARQTAPLDPGKVAILTQAHDARLQAIDSFARLPRSQRWQLALNARPFISALLVRAAEEDPFSLRPETPWPDVTRADLLARSSSVNAQAARCRPLNDPQLHTLRRLHWLDQGMYIAAQNAMFNCGGPWVRLETNGPLSAPEASLEIQTVCPQGTRDTDYRHMADYIGDQPREL